MGTIKNNPQSLKIAASDCGCNSSSDCCSVDRRNFLKTAGMGTALASALGLPASSSAEEHQNSDCSHDELLKNFDGGDWPVLKKYPQTHTSRIALPLGGIGTGTVSLGGRGDLRDWEIMNRPAKGFVPMRGEIAPFFALHFQKPDGEKKTLVLEGPIDVSDYEGSHGSTTPNDNLPRFQRCAFAAAYPLGQVYLSDSGIPVDVRLGAFNPLIPADPDASGIPIAVLRYELINKTRDPLKASICGVLPNFVGMDGWETARDWKGDLSPTGAKKNRNQYRTGQSIQGIFMDSAGIDPGQEQWGSIALATTAQSGVTHRLDWPDKGWGAGMLDFWDDFSVDGTLDPREISGHDMPIASLAVEVELPPLQTKSVVFLIAWRFPNRFTWTPKGGEFQNEDRISNYYATRYSDAWDVIEKAAPQLPELEKRTVEFVRAFCESSLPDEVKEAALFNVSTLRTQTCFRTPDGLFYGYEGCCNLKGCCHGSCTHVWNYEQATAFLFGSLAMSMREVEFGQATDEQGLMSFRVHLPLSRAHDFGKAAADGQMGCIMKMYRDWQLSGDGERLKSLWPNVKRSLEFCWIPGGWDADKDGVMEGCQHNTMDVEYYGPNPQMEIWYLGALRAAEEIARFVGDAEFAVVCRDLFERGKKWTDENLFNGEYYIHKIQPPKQASDIAPSLLVGMGAKDPGNPEYQLGEGCLVDQLVGQYMAHICGLGYLVKPENVQKTLVSIMKYNGRDSLRDHFNCMRTFALGDEAVLLMASYPHSRPENPFPYFTEVMTGFEYAAAVGMLYENQVENGLACIRNIRNRYDGQKRNPFNEAECGHHYARAMASWAAGLALTGFHYSAVQKSMTFAANEGTYFWSTGYAWGQCKVAFTQDGAAVELSVSGGSLALAEFHLREFGVHCLSDPCVFKAGDCLKIQIARTA